MLRLRPYMVYLILGGASAVFLNMIYPMLTLYYVRDVGLNPFELVLVGTVLQVTAFVFEIPTGVIADRVSRRLSVILGELLIGVSFVIIGFTPTFTAVLTGISVFAIGGTCISGALSAWIADELGVDALGRTLLRYNQVRQGGAIVGTLIGIAVASVTVQGAILAGGLLMVALSMFLLLTMPERHFSPSTTAEAHVWSGMRSTLRDGLAVVRGSRVALLLLAVSLVAGAYSEGFDRLWEAHLLLSMPAPFGGNVAPAVWLGLINLGMKLWGMVGSEVLLRTVDLANWVQVGRVLRLSTLGVVASVVVFGATNQFAVAVAALLVAEGLRIVQAPLSEAWLNAVIPSRTRATVLSLASQADALGQIVGGPMIGGIGMLVNLHVALIVNGLLLLPTLRLYGRAMQHSQAATSATSLPPSER